jgi:hypothetical protein
MLDLYDAQIGEGNLVELIKACAPYIGEVQVADVPGRCEPGTGRSTIPALPRPYETLATLGPSASRHGLRSTANSHSNAFGRRSLSHARASQDAPEGRFRSQASRLPILDVIRGRFRSQVPKRSHSVDLTRMGLALPLETEGASPLLEVSLLGEQYVAGSTATNRSSRSIALLSFLAVHADAPYPRQRLAAIIWPDSTERQARTNLRRDLQRAP